MRGGGSRLAVGLVGAGPWAGMVHAPGFADSSEARLAGVWARRQEAAAELANRHGVPAFGRYEELLDSCEAVVFAIPPAAQPEFAVRAAHAGKAVLLEKPLGEDVAGARRIVDAVQEAGVGSMLGLSYRFAKRVQDFLSAASLFGAWGARACFLTGALLDGPFAGSPWRHEKSGLLLDLGPHMIDLLEAALGPVARVRASGKPSEMVLVVLEHANGATSDVLMAGRVGIDPKVQVELYGRQGCLSLDASEEPKPDAFERLRRDFVTVARGGPSTSFDAAHGLHLQQLVQDALVDLG